MLLSEGTPKIADIGIARFVGGERPPDATKTITGTPLYMAPEVFRGTYGFPVDIFALGCILKVTVSSSPSPCSPP